MIIVNCFITINVTNKTNAQGDREKMLIIHRHTANIAKYFSYFARFVVHLALAR